MKNKVKLGVWVGCSCEPEGAFFYLNIWNEMHFTKKTFEQAALKAKLTKDKNQKEYDLYSLRLSTTPDSSSTLPQNLANEVRHFLDQVFRELSSQSRKK